MVKWGEKFHSFNLLVVLRDGNHKTFLFVLEYPFLPRRPMRQKAYSLVCNSVIVLYFWCVILFGMGIIYCNKKGLRIVPSSFSAHTQLKLEKKRWILPNLLEEDTNIIYIYTRIYFLPNQLGGNFFQPGILQLIWVFRFFLIT